MNIDSLYMKINNLPEVIDCYDGKLKTIDSCNESVAAVDIAVEQLAQLRLAIAENKAKLANKFIEENLMTFDERVEISKELSHNFFYDLPAESCFYKWLKKFQDKFLGGCMVNLVNATIDCQTQHFEPWRQSLKLWLSDDPSSKFSVLVSIPLPRSIQPTYDTQEVLGGVYVALSGSSRMWCSESCDIFVDEYDIDAIRSALAKTLCVGKMKELPDFASSKVERLYYGGDRSSWFTSFFSGEAKAMSFLGIGRRGLTKLKKYDDDFHYFGGDDDFTYK